MLRWFRMMIPPEGLLMCTWWECLMMLRAFVVDTGGLCSLFDTGCYAAATSRSWQLQSLSAFKISSQILKSEEHLLQAWREWADLVQRLSVSYDTTIKYGFLGYNVSAPPRDFELAFKIFDINGDKSMMARINMRFCAFLCFTKGEARTKYTFE